MMTTNYRNLFVLALKIALLSAAIGGAISLFRLAAFLREHHFAPLPEPVATVAVRDSYYEPKEVRVQIGDRVVWKNEGLRTHTVTFSNISKTLLPGERWTWKIEAPLFEKGAHRFWDETWQKNGMEGVLIVE